mmetsp:Transcript_10709/g.25179  ORF Transcript_10709/g.25179 Transcript_10709/m.25179 type:complete len:113 (+) Transcript_10709:124-462(+)
MTTSRSCKGRSSRARARARRKRPRELGQGNDTVARRVIHNLHVKSRDVYWDQDDIETAMGFCRDIKELRVTLDKVTACTATSPDDYIAQLQGKIQQSKSKGKAQKAKRAGAG